MRHITVIHPSRGRAGLCAKTYQQAIRYCDDPGSDNVSYNVCVEPDQYDIYNNLCIPLLVNSSKNAIEAINMGFKDLIDWELVDLDIIVVMSDDFVLPKSWDTMIREAVGDRTDFVLKTFDGTQKWICTLPIMDKVYYDQFGYVYNPGYKHMFADTELTHVAELLGKLIARNDVVFPHRTEVTGNDAINKKNNSTWAQGEAFYLQRVKENFGLPEELRKPVSYKPHQQWINQKIK